MADTNYEDQRIAELMNSYVNPQLGTQAQTVPEFEQQFREGLGIPERMQPIIEREADLRSQLYGISPQMSATMPKFLGPVERRALISAKEQPLRRELDTLLGLKEYKLGRIEDTIDRMVQGYQAKLQKAKDDYEKQQDELQNLLEMRKFTEAQRQFNEQQKVQQQQLAEQTRQFDKALQAETEAYQAEREAGPAPTAGIKEYNLAKSQGYPGTFEDWISGVPGTTVGGVDYTQYVNVGGTIYNRVTGEAYATPAELARSMGITADQIKWELIAKGSVPPVIKAPTSTTASTGGYTPLSKLPMTLGGGISNYDLI